MAPAPWRRAASLCAAAAAAALLVRLALAPAGPRVFYDEYEHLDLAWNLASRGTFAGTMAWIPGELDVFRRPLWPPLAHLHYAALFLARGFTESGVWTLNAVLSSAACGAAGLAAFAWLGSPLGAGLTALLLAFSPTHAAYARGADLASVASLWTALAWLAALRGAPRTAGLVLAVAVQARPDGLLLLPPLLWLLAARHGRRAAGPSALAALSALLPLSIAWSARAAGHDGYGDAWTTLLARVPGQALSNAWFFLRPDSPRLLLTLAAAAGFWRARPEPAARALALSAALYFGLYSAYSTAAFANGSGDKYALALELPLALLAAPLFAAPPAALAGGLAVYAALAAHAFRPMSSADYAASDAFLRRLAPFTADAPPVLTFVPPAPKVVLGAAVVHPRLLLEQGPATLDPRGRGFLLLRNESWRFQPRDAAALEAVVKALYSEEELLSETVGGRRRSLSRLRPR